eukprot:Rhum_TRINITY_DN3633_c0_g1::Rhum_TRINITY_DN3633_c0_g1_i1::g.11578::m.11578
MKIPQWKRTFWRAQAWYHQGAQHIQQHSLQLNPQLNQFNVTVINAPRIAAKPAVTAVWTRDAAWRYVRENARVIAFATVATLLTWVWQAAALQRLTAEVEDHVVEAESQMQTMALTLAKVQRTWADRLAPLDARLAVLEGERATQATKLDKLTAALRGSLVAVGQWKYPRSTGSSSVAPVSQSQASQVAEA